MDSTADSPQTGRGGSIPAFRYSASLAAELERKWQDIWEAERTFEAPNTAGPLADTAAVAGREKLFIQVLKSAKTKLVVQ